MDLVGQLLVEVVDLSLELGQVGNLVQQGLDLSRFVSKLLLEGVDEMILLLLTEVEGLNQGFQLLDPCQQFLNSLFERSDLDVLVDNRVLKIMDLPVGIGVLGVQVLNGLDKLGDLGLELLDVGKIGVVLISLLLESRLKTSNLILQGLDSSLESPDLSGLIFDDGLEFVVESLLLGQFVIEVIDLSGEGSDRLREVVVVLLELAIVEPQSCELLIIPGQLLLELGVLFHELLQSGLVLLKLSQRGGEVGLEFGIFILESFD